MRIVIRRDTKANWDANSQVVLLQGEQGYEINVDQDGIQRPTRLKVGDGISQWGQLNYFNGGITAIDEDSIIMDASGKIMFNKDLYLGDLTDASGDTVSAKDYVDAKVAVEAEARTNGDTALSAKIDLVELKSDNNDSALSAALDDSVATLVAADEFEKSERMTADGTLQVQISLLNSELNTTISDSVTALETVDTFLQNQISENKLTHEQRDIALEQYIDTVDARLSDSISALEEDGVWLFADQAAFPSAADNHGRVVHSHADGAQFFAHAGAWHQLANDSDLAAKADLDSPNFTGAPTALVAYDSVQGSSRVATLADVTYTAGLLDNAKADLTALNALQADVDQNEADSDAADAVQDGRLDALEADSVTATEVDLLLADKASLSEANTITAELTVNAPVTVTSSLNATDIGGTFWGDVAAMPAWTAPAAPVDGNSTTAELAAAITDLRVFVNQLHTRLTDDQSSLMP